MRPISVVIPTRRLSTALRERCAGTAACLPGAEIILCEPDDLGPLEAQPRLPAGWRLVRAPRGRGTQCNGGARAASGELLMFLHDDTDLPRDAGSVLETAFRDPGIGMACFRIAFDQRHWLLGAYAWGSRFESRLTTFGDQAMTIRRDLFAAVGGFPDWPLFEDVDLARRVRRCSRIAKLPSAVTTSASRFLANGPARQQLANGLLLARFLLGAPPERLAALYERQRGAISGGDAACVIGEPALHRQVADRREVRLPTIQRHHGGHGRRNVGDVGDDRTLGREDRAFGSIDGIDAELPG